MSLKIDCHTHIGNYKDAHWRGKWGEVTPKRLIEYLDKNGVDKAVVLPTYSLDIRDRTPTEYVIEVCREHPERFIPFCVVEVREEDFEKKLARYVEEGCVGVGEHTSKIPINHRLNCKLYAACGRLELPILIHMATAETDEYGALDTPDLKGLEEVLREYSNVNFIMHGPGWWRCMSKRVDPKVKYPKGKIEEPGRTVQLLEEYENLYGDLSAGSGYNALARDLDFAKPFLERFNRKLLYGTDLIDFFDPRYVHIRLLEGFKLDREAYENIYHRNLERLIRH